MHETTRLEKLADDFIDTVLLDHPIWIFSLEKELNKYANSIQELNDDASRKKIEEEYERSEKKKTIDAEIDYELINDAEKVYNPLKKTINPSIENFLKIPGCESDKEIEATIKDNVDDDSLLRIQLISDSLIHDLAHLVLRSSKTRVRPMDELVDDPLNDPWLFPPERWVYHKNWKLERVLKYIVQWNDEFSKEKFNRKDEFAKRIAQLYHKFVKVDEFEG